MKLRARVPKLYGPGPHREVAVQETFDRMAPYVRQVGVTRIADITGLDRLGIPVHNTIVPRSNDILSVYNGKGTTAIESKTGAVMEAVERYAAAIPRAPAEVASVAEVARRRRTLDPDSINLERFPRFHENVPISWVEGVDILNERSVLVPLFLAGYFALGVTEIPPFTITTTNGLAAGNSLEEAVCHALCEVIERDDWTMADLISHRLSRALHLGTLNDDAGDPVVAAWFHDQFPNIAMETLPPQAHRLVECYEGAGLHLKIKNVTSEIGIPSFIGIVAEYVSDTFSQSHFGLGTHPDAAVAVVRCITEVAQARAVDIQGMREDISLPDQTVDKSLLHVKRKSKINPETWYFKESRRAAAFDDVRSFPSDDVMADLRLMLDRLAAAGLSEVIVVDLSPPDVPAAVVRVIVPEIESYAIDRSRIGRRATARWNAAVSVLESYRAGDGQVPEVVEHR